MSAALTTEAFVHEAHPRSGDAALAARIARTLSRWLAGVIDLRRGEGPVLSRAATAFFLILAADSVLETARDALVLGRFASHELGLVYVAVAFGVMPMAMLSARIAPRVAPRAAVVFGLGAVALALAVLFTAPQTESAVLAVCVASGALGGVVIPSFFGLVGTVFSITQGRRLLGTVAGIGTAGAVAGSALAALLVQSLPVSALLPAAAVLVIFAIVVLPRAPHEANVAHDDSNRASGRFAARPEAFPREPFVARLGLMAMASTAVLVMLDFSFKWAVGSFVPPERTASFVAGFYTFLNAAALVGQLAGNRFVVRRLGVAPALALTPFLVAVGSLVALATGGSAIVVLGLKAIDSVLRDSVHRVTTELAYLPLSSAVRARAKPIIDGVFSRAIQGGLGGALFVAGSHLSAGALAITTAAVSALWFLAAWTTQRPYLALLRKNLGPRVSADASATDPLDVESVEALVGHLSSEDPSLVVGAMNVLARRERARLLPALVLLHDHEGILVRALALLGASDRTDWIARGRKLLGDPRETVRLAAARALAAHGALDATALAHDASPNARAYAALHVARQREPDDLSLDAGIAAILERATPEGERIGLLSAIADAPPDPRLPALLEVLATRSEPSSGAASVELARAAAAQHATALVPALIARLASRHGREAVRAALVSFDTLALEALRAHQRSPHAPRELRMHIPTTLARFGTREAADALLETIEHEGDGLVRYKAIRALGRLVADSGMAVDRERVERLALGHLLEHYRLLGLRVALGSPLVHDASTSNGIGDDILRNLLEAKLQQALERTFRLLKIAYPREDLHRVHQACLSHDRHERAYAAEILDVVLRKRNPRLRALLAIVAGESSAEETLARARRLVGPAPARTRAEALERLAKDDDPLLATVAMERAYA